MTATDAITVALQLIGAVDPGEGPSTSELNDGLVRLNDMLANWALESLNLVSVSIDLYSLVSGTTSYTLGPSGTLGSTRPTRITAATVLQPAAGGGNLRFPQKLASDVEWAAIPFRDSVFAVNPAVMFFNPTFPLASVNFSPVPTFTGTRQVEIHSWITLSQFADLTTPVVFPPGYERAIRYNLGIELAGEYAAMPSPQVTQIAAESKAALRALNGSVPGSMPPAGPTDALPSNG